MIIMSKKGVNTKRTIQRAIIGVRDDDVLREAGGTGVLMQLDDFEILFSVERAESFITQMQSKVRKAKELMEEKAMPERQDGLPMTFPAQEKR